MALANFDFLPDFGDPAAEARTCRSGCALFDFSFLECARLEGTGAQTVIETFIGRSLNALGQGRICYALRADADGRLVADLTIWRTGEESYEVMSGRREDVEDLLAHDCLQARVTDLSPHSAVFAVQGPRTLDALRKLGDVSRLESLKYFAFDYARLAGVDCRIGRLGYTGEAGVEIIADRRDAPSLWKALTSHVHAAGFIAVDTLRIEAGFVLFTHEFRVPVWPREVGLEKFREAKSVLMPEISLVCFRADADKLVWPWRPAKGLQRPSEPGTIVVTSACDSAVAGGILGLGYVVAGNGAAAELRDPNGIFRNIRLTARPFYDSGKRRPRAAW